MISPSPWLTWLLTLALTQLSFPADLEFTTISTLTPGAPASTIWAARAHVEGSHVSGPVSLHLVLDPAVWSDGSASHLIPGLTEAYLRTQAGRLELSAGVERLPLEVGRLTLPFTVEPVDALGQRSGVLGLRATWYPNDATRLRLAAFEYNDVVAPLLSARRQFGAYELEGHALALGGRTALGLGGSGLLGNLVVYGELWALTVPAEWRYAVGVSGSIRNGIWTLEAGYAAPLPGQPLRHQVAGKISRQVAPDFTLSMGGQVFFDTDMLREQASMEFVRSFPDYEFTLTLAGQFGPSPPQGIISASLRTTF